MRIDSKKLDKRVRKAIRHFWATRTAQAAKQQLGGKVDQGLRGAVTGGAQMNGFTQLLVEVACQVGVKDLLIASDRKLELPGFFRPTKKWDLVFVAKGQLLAAIEAKSQVGPSFGNNFNNRTEEAVGTAVDVWTAYREGAFLTSPRPFIGYLFLLEDCSRTQQQLGVSEPYFKVFEEFRDASYARRYELFCRKLVRERHYTAAAFLTARASNARVGQYAEPAADLTFMAFIAQLVGHLAAFAAMGK